MSTISTALGHGYSTARVFIQANPMDLAICDIVAETEKAIQICNVDCKSTCWLPKSALKPYNPGGRLTKVTTQLPGGSGAR